MPPTDNTNPQVPAPEQTPAPVPQPKKLGFWAKLFGKKNPPTAPAPQEQSSVQPTPVPQPQTPVMPAASVEQPLTDNNQQEGTLESSNDSVTDTEGAVISPSVAVPDYLQSTATGKNPTLPIASQPPQPEPQPQPQPQQQPQQPQATPTPPPETQSVQPPEQRQQ